MKSILAGAVLLAALAPLHAQNTFQFLATGSKDGTPVPAVCIQEARAAIQIIKAYPHPDSWTWVVACDDMAWSRQLRHLGWDMQGATLYALTDRAAHVTYLRGDNVLNPPMNPAERPEHVIAHELGHIFLDSSNESKVDALAWKWQKDREHLQVAEK